MASSLPPVLYHFFQHPVPYARTLLLQEKLHELQLSQRRQSQSHKDFLLLLQHRPVYTTGRRQIATSPEVLAEETRLTQIGADFVTTQRGGQLTYHGPGQIVGYPLMDLGRTTPTLHTRDYICKMQKLLERHLYEEHGIQTIPSEHTGVFLNENTKVASIGVQVRHRLTTHGFAFNVTTEPKRWFDRVVACGLDGVRAGCIADASSQKESISVEGEIPSLVEGFGKAYERRMEKLNLSAEGEAGELIMELEEAANTLGGWVESPLQAR